MRTDGPLGPVSKLWLGAEVARTYLQVRHHVSDPDLRNVVTTLRDEPLAAAPAPPPDMVPLAARLARATRRTLRLLPGDTRCLSQSLVLSTLLARRGVASRLVIGVAPGKDFGAHAWVELPDGRALLPRHGSAFERLVDL
jgi:hypothetical protein